MLICWRRLHGVNPASWGRIYLQKGRSWLKTQGSSVTNTISPARTWTIMSLLGSPRNNRHPWALMTQKLYKYLQKVQVPCALSLKLFFLRNGSIRQSCRQRSVQKDQKTQEGLQWTSTKAERIVEAFSLLWQACEVRTCTHSEVKKFAVCNKHENSMPLWFCCVKRNAFNSHPVMAKSVYFDMHVYPLESCKGKSQGCHWDQ